jgi:hypothetical protein
MPGIDDFFPSKYLRCSDLKGQSLTVTIDHVGREVFENDGEKVSKPVIVLRETGLKPFVVNRTNFMLIAALCGNDTDNWPGKRIILAPDLVSYKGQVTEAVRVKRPPEMPAPEVPQIPEGPSAPTDPDDYYAGYPY